MLKSDGTPIFSSGNFAVVFKMEDIQTGEFYAIKCFTREQPGRNESYRKISERLSKIYSPFISNVEYLDCELFVDTVTSSETEFPVVKMDWITGDTLGEHIRKNISDKAAIEDIICKYIQLSKWLINQDFAHGDLKPDNIIVTDSHFMLVDYDGMFVPEMVGETSREMGSPDYTHPFRPDLPFDKHIDDFALVSILLSLKSISIKPDLLEKSGSIDSLCFKREDYTDIANSIKFKSLSFVITDAMFSHIYSCFLSVLQSGRMDYESLTTIKAFSQSLQTNSTSNNLLFINDLLWKISHSDYIEGLGIDDNTITISNADGEVKIFWSDNHYFISANDGRIRILEKIPENHLKRMLVNLSLLDKKLENKLNAISGKFLYAINCPELAPIIAKGWIHSHYPDVSEYLSFSTSNRTINIISGRDFSEDIWGYFIPVIQSDKRFHNKLHLMGITNVIIENNNLNQRYSINL